MERRFSLGLAEKSPAAAPLPFASMSTYSLAASSDFDPFVVPSNLLGTVQNRNQSATATQPIGGMGDLHGIGGLGAGGQFRPPTGPQRDLTASLLGAQQTASMPPWVLAAQAQAKSAALPNAQSTSVPASATAGRGASSNLIEDLLYLDLGAVSAPSTSAAAPNASSSAQDDLLGGPLYDTAPSNSGAPAPAPADGKTTAEEPSSSDEVDADVKSANIERAQKLLGVTGSEKPLATVLVRIPPKKKTKKYLQCAPGDQLIIVGQVCCLVDILENSCNLLNISVVIGDRHVTYFVGLFILEN